MSYLFRLACATGLVFASMSILHAAPVCSSIAAKLQAIAPVSSQGITTEAIERSRACAQNCTVAGLRSTAMKIALPGPAHLPVVSDPDEVAAWHAEIFERLAAARAGLAATQYCKLDLLGQSTAH